MIVVSDTSVISNLADVRQLGLLHLKSSTQKVMNIDTEILQTVVAMPEPLKRELLHYAKYLLENYTPDITTEPTPVKKRRSGILEGTFVLPLPDDFDEPLEDFQEYMS